MQLSDGLQNYPTCIAHFSSTATHALECDADMC
jgi:hypothetical protein